MVATINIYCILNTRLGILHVWWYVIFSETYAAGTILFTYYPDEQIKA